MDGTHVTPEWVRLVTGPYFILSLAALILVTGFVASGGLKKITGRVKSVKRGDTVIEMYGGKEGKKECRKNAGRRESDVCGWHHAITEKINASVQTIADLVMNDGKHAEHLNEIWVDQLKLVFYNRDMPLGDRMFAGLRYVWWGENHDMKRDVELMKDGHPEVYNAVITGPNKKYAWGNFKEKGVAK